MYADLLHETHALMVNTYGDHFNITVETFELMVTTIRCLKTFSESECPKSPEIDGWILSHIVYAEEVVGKDDNDEIDDEELSSTISFNDWLHTSDGQHVRAEKEALRLQGSRPIVTRDIVERIYENASEAALTVSSLWADMVNQDQRAMVAASSSEDTSKRSRKPSGSTEDVGKPESSSRSKSASAATKNTRKPVKTPTIQQKSSTQLGLEKKTVAQLKADAKGRGLHGYSRSKKEDLIKKILEDEGEVWVQ